MYHAKPRPYPGARAVFVGVVDRLNCQPASDSLPNEAARPAQYKASVGDKVWGTTWRLGGCN